MTERTTADVLRNTRETLDTALQGLADLTGENPRRCLTGMRNAVVFGRSVTYVLQTMRSVDRDAFDAWYTPVQKEMIEDPLLKFFGDLRNEILKEGTPKVTSWMYIESIDSSDLAALKANPPPGAKGFFIGDQLGGSGWEIELPDGTIEKYYVQLPDSLVVQNSLHLDNPPTTHLGQPISDTSMGNLVALFVAYLCELVDQAEAHFG